MSRPRRTDCPSTDSSPPEGGQVQEIIFMVVVFPAPFGPRKPKHSRSPTSKSTPRTASNSSKRLVTPRATTTEERWGSTATTQRVYRLPGAHGDPVGGHVPE